MDLKLPSLSKLNSLQQRLISAAIALPFFLFALIYGGFIFAGLIIVIAMIAGHEWLNLVTKKRSQSLDYLIYASLSFPLAIGFLLGFKGGVIALFTCFILSLGLSSLIVPSLKENPPLHISASILYLGLPFLCVIWLREHGVLSVQSPQWAAVLGLFVMVWVTDTGAYFSGKSIGGPKIAPKISPNKTWAGLIGGTIFTILVAVVLAYVFETGPLWVFVIMGLILPTVAQIGDFFESFLKRRAGVKDSGHILPGHGGILDRLDGVLTAAPFYTIILTLIAK